MSGIDELMEAASGGVGHGELPLWSRVGYLIRRLHQIHSAIFVEECQEFGLTPVQYGLLTALHYFPGSDQVSLGREVGIDRTNVADVLERLAERGLVRRERSVQDRRSKIAFLTPAGETILEQGRAGMLRAQGRILAPLAPAFRPAFLAVLTQLIDGNSQTVPSESGFDVERRPRKSPSVRPAAEADRKAAGKVAGRARARSAK